MEKACHVSTWSQYLGETGSRDLETRSGTESRSDQARCGNKPRESDLRLTTELDSRCSIQASDHCDDRRLINLISTLCLSTISIHIVCVWRDGLRASVIQQDTHNSLSQAEDSTMPGRSMDRSLMKFSPGIPGWKLISVENSIKKSSGRIIDASRRASTQPYSAALRRIVLASRLWMRILIVLRLSD